MKEIRDTFREMLEEPVPADSLARVRLAVARRIDPASRRFAWSFAAAALALACLAVVFLLGRRAETGVQPVSPVVAQGQTPPAPPPASVQLPRRTVTVKKAPLAGDQMLIRIETPDPDVVILLIGDGADGPEERRVNSTLHAEACATCRVLREQ